MECVLIKMGLTDLFERYINKYFIDRTNILEMFENISLADTRTRDMFIVAIKHKKIYINPKRYLSDLPEMYLDILMTNISEDKLIKYLNSLYTKHDTLNTTLDTSPSAPNTTLDTSPNTTLDTSPNTSLDSLISTLNIIQHYAFIRKFYNLQKKWIYTAAKLELYIEYKNYTSDINFNIDVIIELLKHTDFNKLYLTTAQYNLVCDKIRKTIR
jgi:hypothetical protein